MPINSYKRLQERIWPTEEREKHWTSFDWMTLKMWSCFLLPPNTSVYPPFDSRAKRRTATNRTTIGVNYMELEFNWAKLHSIVKWNHNWDHIHCRLSVVGSIISFDNLYNLSKINSRLWNVQSINNKQTIILFVVDLLRWRMIEQEHIQYTHTQTLRIKVDNGTTAMFNMKMEKKNDIKWTLIPLHG